MSNLKSYLGGGAFVLLVLGFGISMGSKCSDGTMFNTYLAVGLAFEISGADICDHRSALLHYGR
ncbi:hypothetical protein [Aquipseudomonas alcaligenes]|uniref:Uncharacterized protein n=1 Tax=Aquipseudomonas alcaligenes (strain ATCC 14909 / DSM 50342 / CCUG 1425 / JCM 20561 / NBRC 14159 / NCIMB 9945 / NCTC 10367 / 1577) TaxID=1215092 RepID=U3AWL8_AQUA1|nr:hypothetical protein [Pseudomonas alcaligenes]GAD62049.1 hypothetical protein PA6_009_00550 [Pseudomonas alcaligenes NBRC 14159]SUD16462.1 Uncharacterised protein [Pseudomonas alcaligenes]